MKKSVNKNDMTLDGMMTTGLLINGLRRAQFECCDDVEVEAYVGRFKVQGMRDGNMYLEELPKRTRNKPLIKLDNSSLTLGRNGWYYFLLRLPESEVEMLPTVLMREARQTAKKVMKEILYRQ